MCNRMAVVVAVEIVVVVEAFALNRGAFTVVVVVLSTVT